MKKHTLLFLSFILISSYAGQCQKCYDRSYLKDECRVGVIACPDVQTTEQYNASFIGCEIPEFKATLTDGSVVSNLSLKGKMVFMYFWSAREPFNIREVPYLNQIADSMKQKNVEFIAICRDDPAKWDKKYEGFFHFQHIAQSRELLEKFPSHPTVIIFDGSGATMFSDNIIYMGDPVLKDRSDNYLYVLGSGLSLMGGDLTEK